MTPVRLERRPRGGGGTPIFSYILRLGSIFGVQNFEFQYFGAVSEFFFFWGGVYEDFVDIFCGIITNWTIFSGYFDAF